ncbi:MAG: MBL fold metallo-hydrolase [Bacillota bacterium]
MISIDNIVIKTLVDNTSATPFVMAEWGLSIFLNIEGRKILFDTGAGNSQVLVNNMEVMDVSPENIDLLVLSHGHQDHTGGLRKFLEKMRTKNGNKEIEIISHPEALKPQYIKKIGSFGCPFTEEELQSLGARFKFSKKPTWINDNIIVSGEVPMINNYEEVGEGFYREFGENDKSYEIVKDKDDLGFKIDNKKFVKDEEIIDDQAIFIKTELGLIVILGCAHRGIINTIHYGQKITNMNKIYMVIGGTHTANVSDYRLESTIKELKRLNVRKVGVSHCTGLVSGCKLSNALGGDVFFHNNAGSVIKFENKRLKVNEF